MCYRFYICIITCVQCAPNGKCTRKTQVIFLFFLSCNLAPSNNPHLNIREIRALIKVGSCIYTYIKQQPACARARGTVEVKVNGREDFFFYLFFINISVLFVFVIKRQMEVNDLRALNVFIDIAKSFFLYFAWRVYSLVT